MHYEISNFKFLAFHVQFLDFFIIYLHRRHDAYKRFNKFKSTFCLLWDIGYIAKSKKGMNNLLAEWRSVARADSVLGLPVF